jgi:HTH-type transcriptional regulator/antitoxin HigA
MINSKTRIAIPPGATIREQLEDRGMKQKEFALRMGLSEKHISRLINGQVELTQDVSLRLESVLGVPASFWNNLEAAYREKVARVIAENDLDHDSELASKFPYSKMVALGWIAVAKNTMEKALNLRRYFEVAKLELLDGLRIPGISYRRTGVSESSDYALAVWAQKARIEARKSATAPINISKLEQSILHIRSMTILKPAVFCSEIASLLAECGIALVFLPHIDGSFLHGASFYDGNHIVMGLTVRGRDADKFWFSLFHELCHVIRGHLTELDETNQAQEDEANAYARDLLIPPEQYQEFMETNYFTKESIITFASKIEIAPGIVLGRLQKENHIPYTRFNELKEKYKIAC